MLETSDERDGIWPFLTVAPKHDKASVVLLGEEFERGGVFEGVDVVFLGEADGERSFKGVEVLEKELAELAASGAAEEEGDFGVFRRLWCADGKGAGGACVARFSVVPGQRVF